jgi:DNA-binding NtrC family response regulator
MKDTISVVAFDPEDPCTVESLAEALSEYQSVLIPCTTEETMQDTIERQPVDVVVLNLQKPFEDAFGLLSQIQDKAPQAEVIFGGQFDDEMLWAWMEVIQRGAYEFLPKPFDPDELKHHVVHAAEKHHAVRRRKRPPAESVKDLNAAPKRKALPPEHST